MVLIIRLFYCEQPIKLHLNFVIYVSHYLREYSRLLNSLKIKDNLSVDKAKCDG
ncbi:hypothetical protein VCRA2133O162_260074 [Vibrio crassostreae]|uniref:Uncharacterized protein n=1 Tax=Vibrio crassostreae TaxID=246167 RepID=A0A822MQE7_9VIBR|nr:hypothetical protein VCRA2117O142_100074 [Vibrio crassostreae]CAK3879760.1 hypothetical protein VCRA2133O162_260074 [Vibrio crassostreae]CDT13158.1 hypothetical protein VCR5J5_1490054 [Vibrio crassostreae]CDT70962.1 hypothetical protein VCR9J2_920027 [Vibrio crassostreae]